MQDETVVAEFTHQAEAFNTAAVANAAATLDDLVALAEPRAHERWLEIACGPAIVSRKLAPSVREVHGVDMTPAMIDLARREATRAGLTNATFAVGDATALDLPDAGVDGAIARFSLHHIAVPGRLIEELARVVRSGGRIVLADHLADDDPDAAAWAQEIERLRDPSHWVCLTLRRLHACGTRAGLTLDHEAIVPITLDFEEWVRRGSGGPTARATIERALRDRPERSSCFDVREDEGHRVLELRVWLSRWRR